MTETTQSPGRGRRILLFTPVKVVLGILWLALLVGLTEMGFQKIPSFKSDGMQLLSMVVVVLVAYLAYFAFVRVVERRPLVELSRNGAAVELARGVLIGALLFTLTIGILWSLGYFTVSGFNNWTVLIPALAMSVVSGFFEELLFRGLLFRIVEESLGTWLSLLISALVFGLLHVLNPNATLMAGLAIALEAGILLAAAYVFTRKLWLAIGLHFAWNFTQGGIFGVAVSGFHASGLLQSHLSGPNILSGGEFGAEASLAAVVVCTSAGILFLWRAKEANRFIKPRWRR